MAECKKASGVKGCLKMCRLLGKENLKHDRRCWTNLAILMTLTISYLSAQPVLFVAVCGGSRPASRPIPTCSRQAAVGLVFTSLYLREGASGGSIVTR